ncbi:hypothetical protein M5D96_005951 [Drosophila gunungcola]|uniref:Uncharacterized protein n=1 Tax=Drosophila gunungcola TaxID=103775 RepID=A0A9P9YRE4_9MUSC|nr:hypothetical protein M5D96_005951 [Drosophila gunungcola]
MMMMMMRMEELVLAHITMCGARGQRLPPDVQEGAVEVVGVGVAVEDVCTPQQQQQHQQQPQGATVGDVAVVILVHKIKISRVFKRFQCSFPVATIASQASPRQQLQECRRQGSSSSNSIGIRNCNIEGVQMPDATFLAAV